MTKPQPTYRKTISRLERKNNSVNGNPAYEVHFTDGASARTQSDAMVSYEIPNPEYEGVEVDVWTTPSGQIWDAVPVTGHPRSKGE